MINERNGNVRGSLANLPRLKPIRAREQATTHKENLESGRAVTEEESKANLSLIPAETRKIRKHYLDEILRNELAKVTQSYRPEFLKSHRVSCEIRARMVDLSDRLDDRSSLEFQLRSEYFFRFCRHHGQFFFSLCEKT